MEPFPKILGSATFLLFLLIGAPLFGQTEGEEGKEEVDIIRLKDGSVLRGRIQDLGNDSVQIEIQGGNSLKFSRSRIVDIEFDVPKDRDAKGKEKSPSRSEDSEKNSDQYGPVLEDQDKGGTKDGLPYHRKGYQHHLAQGFLANLSETGPNPSFLLNPHIYSIHTYRFSPLFATGIYAGVQILSNVPAGGFYHSYGLTVTGDILKSSSVTPFYEVQAGYSDLLSETYDRDGLYGNVGIGGKAFYGNTKGISLLLSYQFYRMRGSFQYMEGYETNGKELVDGLGVRITFHM